MNAIRWLPIHFNPLLSSQVPLQGAYLRVIFTAPPQSPHNTTLFTNFRAAVRSLRSPHLQLNCNRGMQSLSYSTARSITVTKTITRTSTIAKKGQKQQDVFSPHLLPNCSPRKSVAYNLCDTFIHQQHS